MRTVLQRVICARVKSAEKVIASIGQGAVILVGISQTDTESEADKLVRKISGLRIFADQDNKFNLSVKQINGEILAVPQFTLYSEVKGQNRPYFGESAKPESAKSLFEYFLNTLKKQGIKKVGNGIFGSHMELELVNDGPVTIILDTDDF